jgi:hypothetical protein
LRLASLAFICYPSRLSFIRIRRHENEQRKASFADVAHAVRFAGRRKDDLIWTKNARLFADEEFPAPIKDKIDLIGVIMTVDFLLLSGLETVDIAKEIPRFEEIRLPHLVGRKPTLCYHIFTVHSYWIVSLDAINSDAGVGEAW